MKGKNWLWIGLGTLAFITICCVGIAIGRSLSRADNGPVQIGGGDDKPERPSTPLSTATAVPIPPPPSVLPSAPPADSDLQDLVYYANAILPILVEAGEILERDGEILKSAEGGNDAVLCDGRLEADNDAMQDVLNQARVITPPDDAAAIHDLVLRSGDAWTEALDNVELFCATGNQLYKVPAVIKFWEAAANIQDAGNRFWLLLLSKGVEDWVQR